ncbi:NAD-dependent epimerase/dehydratase family protein [Streptomyces sp. FIT100]|uniref:NAD-dependent epimerase/dehydratase family protein n=1 Tax=Streptomyces sp. FIT100 TaxID=2837956 RepID=UPI0021C8D633|nr:NAD-dependent epimerase/dehydratase family protein [Streptomyces sp. FIT100]UUN29793.1 NAD-dependent epimerase/dehydratase family protein [Streptomyces sp. FIT100]
MLNADEICQRSAVHLRNGVRLILDAEPDLEVVAEAVTRALQDPAIDPVHCAANVGAPLGVATNLALDPWYFRWLARTGTPRAVYYSSSAAYPVALQRRGPIHRLPETEVDPARPGQLDATYGLAKLTGELLVPYAEAEGTRVTVLRPAERARPRRGRRHRRAAARASRPRRQPSAAARAGPPSSGRVRW